MQAEELLRIHHEALTGLCQQTIASGNLLNAHQATEIVGEELHQRPDQPQHQWQWVHELSLIATHFLAGAIERQEQQYYCYWQQTDGNNRVEGSRLKHRSTLSF